ncbi:hypothetical protein RI367_007834 [Sorochytrium milnesiophthora]
MSSQQPFDFSNPPPFTVSQYVLISVLLVTFMTGSILNGFLSYVLLKNKQAFSNNVNMTLTTLLNLADSITPTALIFYQLVKLSFGRYAMGYWEGALISVGVNCGLFFVILIAIERFCVVVREFRRPWQFWRWPALATGLLGVLLPASSLFGVNTPYVIQPSGVYCLDNLEDAGNQSTYLIMFPAVLLIISGAYYSIYRHVFTVTQAASKAMGKKTTTAPAAVPGATIPTTTSVREGPESDVKTSQTTSHPLSTASKTDASLPSTAVPASNRPTKVSSLINKVRSPKSSSGKAAESTNRAEKQAFKTSIGITACFFVMLIPYLINLIALTAGYPTPPWLDGVLAFFGISNLLTDATIMYTLNPRVRKMVQDELNAIRGRVAGILGNA